MGEPTSPEQTMLLLAAFSRDPAAIAWALEQATRCWGSVALASPVFDFCETDYYQASMGPDLQKSFYVFEAPFDPAELADVKLQTNEWERLYAERAGQDVVRPLNLDPGYLTSAKLILASTKDHAHRIYLQRGIFAEVTLHYQQRAWRDHPWTFPDYRRADYQAFFEQARQLLRARVRQERT